MAIPRERYYHKQMAGLIAISIKLPEATVRRLRWQAKARGSSVSALVRERLDEPRRDGQTVGDLAGDLVGSVNGPAISATNDRIKFRRHRG